ncbi:hypothetical protein COB72_07750 [bacterium]|nr:MAG: hypothetical protein COB72_07750 [bacterium]
MDRNWFISGICVLALAAAVGCSSTQHAAEQLVVIAPFDVPTSAPRPEADEPIERFVVRWNAWVDSVPEDQRVGDAVERAKDRMNEKLGQIPDFYKGYDAFEVMGLAKPGGYFWEEAGRIYESIAPELDLMRELVQREAVAIHIDLDPDEEDVFSLFNSYSWSVNDAASVLRYRVRYLVLAGRVQESVGDILAIFDTERLIRESPNLLSWLVAGGSRDTALNMLRKALEIDPDAYTDEQLAEFQDRLADWVDEDLTPVIKAEEYFAILRLRDLYSESIDGKLSEEATQMIIEEFATAAMFRQIFDLPFVFGMEKGTKRSKIEFAPLDQQIAMLKEYNTALIADLDAYPPTVSTSYLDQLEDDVRINIDAVSFIPALMLTGLNEILPSVNILKSIEARATIIVLAIHRHRLATGDWPKSLEDISAEHLRIDPIDMHTGDPFGYTVMNDRPRLWSGGPDGDDDDGTSVKPTMKKSSIEPYDEYEVDLVRSWFTLDQWDALSEEDQAKYDGDWILYPPKWEDRWGHEEY